jgi:hypothetical protein
MCMYIAAWPRWETAGARTASAGVKPQSKNLKERGTIFVMETCDRQLVLLNFVEVTPR